MESVFSIEIVRCTWQLEFFKRNATKDVFLISLQNFHRSRFSSILSKMYEEIFLKRLVNQRLHFRPFNGKLPTISEYSKKTFFLESAFPEFRNSGLLGCSVREKGTVLKRFFWNF